ncbi:MAG: hypothetical protein RLN96_07655 [Pseudomonadales bacterium]
MAVYIGLCITRGFKLYPAARVVVLVTLFLLSSCASYLEQDGPPAGQVFGDMAKCALPENHGLPGCFCHELALARYPDRQESCKPVVRASADQIDDYQIGNCENPIVAMESLESLSERKEAFCSMPGNRDLSSCYCYPPVVEQRPERQDFCQNVETGELPKDLRWVERRSVGWLEEMRQRTRPLGTLVDEPQESWADNTEAYLHYLSIEDDCDAVDSLLDLAFAVGGFELFELSKILVDTNPRDHILADHYVAGVWVDGQWYYLEAANFEVRTLDSLEFGDFFSSQQEQRAPSRLVAYRRLDQSEWYQGRPPMLNSAVASFCPVPATMLF